VLLFFAELTRDNCNNIPEIIDKHCLTIDKIPSITTAKGRVK
jgi:hypothetical protein